MNATDLKPVSLADARFVDVVEVLARVAEHLTVSRPTAPWQPDALRVVVDAKAYDVRPRGGCRLLADAVLKVAPVANAGVTRGEYALVLRRFVIEGGYEWSEDDNKPVIREPEPSPRPRQVPLPGPRQPQDGVR